jgi:hypothetical protein
MYVSLFQRRSDALYSKYHKFLKKTPASLTNIYRISRSGDRAYARFGVRGKSLNFNQNLFLALPFNSRDEEDSIIYLFWLELF